MAVKTPTLNLDHISLREALNRIANQPDLLAWALAGIGFLYGDLAKQSPGCPSTEDSMGSPLNIRFGDLPCTPTSDTSSHETPGATEEKEITPGSVVQIVETRTEASDAKKLKDNNKMWKERRLEDDAIFREITELSAALGLEKTPCSRHHTKHHTLVKVLAGLKKDLTQQKKTAAQKAADNAAQAATEKKKAAPKTAAENASGGKTAAVEAAAETTTCEEAGGSVTGGMGNENQEKNSNFTQLPTAINTKKSCSEIHDDHPPEKTQDAEKTAAEEAAVRAAEKAAETAAEEATVQRAAEKAAAEKAAADAAAASKTAVEEALAGKTAAAEAAAVTTTCVEAGIDTGGTGNENQEELTHYTAITAAQPEMPCSKIHDDQKTQDAEKTAAGEAAARAAEKAAETAAKEAALQRAAEKAAAVNAAAEAAADAEPPPYPNTRGKYAKQKYDATRAVEEILTRACEATFGSDLDEHRLSPDLKKLVLSTAELDRGRHYYDEMMWEVKIELESAMPSPDAVRIFSAETYARLFRQLAYWFSPEHLAGDTHSSKLYCQDNGITFKEIMLWRRMQGITLPELTELVGAVGLYFRSNIEADYTNIDWDEKCYRYDGLSDDLNGMSDDDKKGYLLKNADQDELNHIYWDEKNVDWNEGKHVDFIVFSRKLVNS